MLICGIVYPPVCEGGDDDAGLANCDECDERRCGAVCG